MKIRTKITLLIPLFVTVSLNIKAQDVLPPGFDRYVDQVLEAFQVPGVGIGIVKNGEIVLSKGYGVKKMGDPDMVDENTLFSIASNSKAFTATAMSILVEEGKVKWEDKVIQYLPWFKMSDDYVTAQMTIRDLFVHRSGIKAYANDILLFPPSKYTRKELLMKLKNVELVSDFRSAYAYDNILYLAAGEIIETVSGISWEDFVKQRIFDPVGMHRSVARFSDLRKQSNLAYAHAIREGELRVIDTFFDQNIGDAANAAGGIASSALDMSKWLITQLDSGRTPGQKRIFKPRTTRELWTGVTPIPIPKVPSKFQAAQKHFNTYALGFRISDYRGHMIVEHSGALTGFVSVVAMMPELDLGIVILTNQRATGAYWSILYHLLDYNMQAPTTDWLTGYKLDWDKTQKRNAATREKRSKLKADTSRKASLSLDRYAGKYKDELMGPIEITYDDEGLHLIFEKAPFFNGKLEHFHGDLFQVHYTHKNRGSGPMISFSLNPDLSIREAKFISSFTGASRHLEGLSLKPVKR